MTPQETTTLEAVSESAYNWLKEMQSNETYVVESPEGQAMEVQFAFLLAMLERISLHLEAIRDKV